MPDVDFVTEIISWEDDEITIKLSGIKTNLAEKRAEQFAERRIHPETEILNITETPYSEGFVRTYSVTLKKVSA